MINEEALFEQLGLKIEVRFDGAAGTVIWKSGGVRPATGAEIRLWQTLCAAIEKLDKIRVVANSDLCDIVFEDRILEIINE